MPHSRKRRNSRSTYGTTASPSQSSCRASSRYVVRDHYLAQGEGDPDELESLRAAMASVDPEALKPWPRELYDALLKRLATA